MSVIKQGEDMSINEREFILTALKDENCRADGRTPADTRELRVTYARAEGQATAEIQLGKTRVLTVVTSELTPPYPDRPAEGFLNLNVEYSPMATLGIDNARTNPTLVEVDRVIERCLRQSRALDTEALCVIAGSKVWSLRCDVRILDDAGNVVDAACLATVAALMHFRLPEVTVLTGGSDERSNSSANDGESSVGRVRGGGGLGHASVVVHHSFEKEPSALPIHHVPICVTFVLFNTSPIVSVIDPTEREELVMGGRITFSINVHREVCAMQKIGGLALAPTSLARLAEIAMEKVGDWHSLLQTSLEAADSQAKAERLRCVRGTASMHVRRGALGDAEGERGEKEVEGGADAPTSHIETAHLDFAELHAPIKVREGSEKAPIDEEEETRTLSVLEQAALDAEDYRMKQGTKNLTQGTQETQFSWTGAATRNSDTGAVAGLTDSVVTESTGVNDVRTAACPGSTAQTAPTSHRSSMETKPAGARELGRKTKTLGRRMDVRNGEGRDTEEEDDEEEGDAVMMVSEFASSTESSLGTPYDKTAIAATGSNARRPSSQGAPQATATTERAENDDEEIKDLRDAVKKPRVRGQNGSSSGRGAAKRPSGTSSTGTSKNRPKGGTKR
ncbi:exosome complex component RRP45 [Nannochloropsis gaditana CCMP526]|uniref:Exosome complex component RRP45 n=1 Tax=Nannochloropsis gaditana (strain CCMP526) TaxID=1093141 RepID=I2CP19_NANGC|nr:exosome complex component RRP45 [Nannochloropsis gaditana CCMP526]EKU21492.1 exosome complex component RRP45 [Nannochloropsis gaditana CCMP526]|eukprot:XP_005854866.1 exosome complex component RRP45 [Nannochloropsis gaditana CCMP526]